MPTKIILILSSILILIFDSTKAQSQDINKFNISGIVRDNSNLPLEDCQIVVMDDNSNLLMYKFTNDLGKFKIEIEHEGDTLYLILSRLGYQAIKDTIINEMTKKTWILNIANSSTLDEIVIEDKQAIRKRNDTLVFKIESFTTGIESNLEEVLDRLPGVNVNKSSGEIKYQGREIIKITLDGQDLVGEDYKIISKNLSPNWIEEIEILKNYQDNRLYSGIIDSEEVAINLKFSEEMKGDVAGTVDLGGGYRNKYETEVEIISLRKKIKGLFLAKANNTGQNLETYDIQSYEIVKRESNSDFNSSNPVFYPDANISDEIEESRFSRNNGVFASNSLLYNYDESLSIRLISMFYLNKINFDIEDVFFFQQEDGGFFKFEQFAEQKNRPYFFSQQLKIDKKLSEKSDITIKANYHVGSNRTVTRYSVLDSREVILSSKKAFFFNLNYINKLNKRWVLTTEGLFSIENIDDSLSVQQSNTLISELLRNNSSKKFRVGLDGRLNDFFTISWTNAFVNIDGDLSSTQLNLDLKQQIDSLNNNQNKLYSDIGIKYNKKKLNLFGNLRFNNFRFNFLNNNYSYFLLEPTFGFKYDLSKDQYFESEIKMLAMREFKFLDNHQIAPFSIRYNFRNIVRNSIFTIEPSIHDKFVLRFDFLDTYKLFVDQGIELAIISQNNIYLNNLLIDENVFLSLNIQQGTSLTNYFKYGIDKYFDKISTNVSVEFKYYQSKIPTGVNNLIHRNKINERDFSLNLGTSISKKLSLSASFNLSRSSSLFMNNRQEFNLNNYFFGINYRSSQNSKFVVKNYFYDLNESEPGLLISDLNYSLTIKENKFYLDFVWYNVFNKKHFNITTIDPMFYSFSNYSLLPSMLIASLKFQFR